METISFIIGIALSWSDRVGKDGGAPGARRVKLDFAIEPSRLIEESTPSGRFRTDVMSEASLNQGDLSA